MSRPKLLMAMCISVRCTHFGEPDAISAACTGTSSDHEHMFRSASFCVTSPLDCKLLTNRLGIRIRIRTRIHILLCMHAATLDSLQYDYQGTGSYVDCADTGGRYEVQTCLKRWRGSMSASVAGMFGIKHCSFS